jgi:hypothetical protein
MKLAFLVTLFFCFFQGCVPKENVHTTHAVFVDHATKIKKEVTIKSSGSGGGITASGPGLIEQSIKKETKDGRLLYNSHKTTVMSGCLEHTAKLDIASYNSDGSYQTLTLKGETFYIQHFDVANKLISENKYKEQDFIKPEWVDAEDY